MASSIYFIPLVVKDLKYADCHKWVKVDGNYTMIGITNHALAYVELPKVGVVVTQGGSPTFLHTS